MNKSPAIVFPWYNIFMNFYGYVKEITGCNGNQLKIPKHSLTLRKNGVYFTSIKYWNQLPIEVREKWSYCKCIK